jgi:DNA-binding NtrC family response regulator
VALPSDESATSALERERVLIVDDDPSVSVLLAHILGVEGYLCVNAASVGEARRSLVGGSFDLILCDVGLPDGSGLDLVAEAIAADEHLAALVVSGLDEVALGERACRSAPTGTSSSRSAPTMC